ncbi:MAG: PAS domain S-box protein, partial [Microcoleus sp.]
MFAKNSHFSNPETNNSHRHSPDSETDAEKFACSREVEGDWYRTLYDNFPGIYFVLDSLGRVVSLNLGGASRLGYAIQELVSHSIFNIFYCQDRGRLEAEFATLVQLDNSQEHPKIAVWKGGLICKDGRIIWVKATARAVAQEGAEIEENSQYIAGDFSLPHVLLVCEEIATETSAIVAPENYCKNWRGQTQAIAKLAKSQIRERSNLQGFLREITETAVNILEVDRASIWLYGDDR